MALPEMSGEDLMNKNVIEIIGLIWSIYNETDYRRNYSANITRDFLAPSCRNELFAKNRGL